MTPVHVLTFIPSNITHCVCKGNCGYLFETLELFYRKAVNHISVMHHCTQNFNTTLLYRAACYLYLSTCLLILLKVFD